MRTSRRIFLKSAVGLTGAATAFHASAASRFLPGQIGKWKLADTKIILKHLLLLLRRLRNHLFRPRRSAY